MDFSEVIGFFVTLAAIAYMFIKRVRDTRDRPDLSEDGNEENKLEDFLKSLEEDMEESKDFKPAPIPKVVKVTPKPLSVQKIKQPTPKQVLKQKEGEFRSNLDGYTSYSAIEERKLKTNIKSQYEGDYGEHLLSKGFRHDPTHEIFSSVGMRGPSRVKELLHSLPSKKDMILINEIFNKPKGLS